MRKTMLFGLGMALALSCSFPARAEISRADVVAAVNEYRAENGLSELNYDSTYEGAADVRAKESVSLWSHTRPDGSEWWTADPAHLYGENLAYGQDTAADLIQAWVDSDTHRANLLGNFTTCAVGISGNHYALEFGR